MVDLEKEYRDLIEADRHIAEWEKRETEQAARLSELERAGDDTLDTERYLTMFRRTLEGWRTLRALIAKMIEQEEKQRQERNCCRRRPRSGVRARVGEGPRNPSPRFRVGSPISSGPCARSRTRGRAETTGLMIFDRDLYAAAGLMIKQHGDLAVIQAAMRADEFGAKNNIDGQLHWIRVMRAIQALQRPRAIGEGVN